MTIYEDDKVFDTDGISIIPNMDIFLEILSGMIYSACEVIFFLYESDNWNNNDTNLLHWDLVGYDGVYYEGNIGWLTVMR